MGTRHSVPAKEVSEEILEATGTAILCGDYATFKRYFRLPHFIATAETQRTIETEEEFQTLFAAVHEDYLRKQITDLVRICDVAEYRTPFRIEATHTTHMMAGDRRVTDPFPSFSVIEFNDGRWQISSSQYAVDSKTTVGRAITERFSPPE